MSRVCPVTQKRVGSGCKVSHAHNRSKRLFVPNLQNVSFISNALGFSVSLRISTSGIKTIEKFGGIDNFLKNAKKKMLDSDMLRLRKIIISKTA